MKEKQEEYEKKYGKNIKNTNNQSYDEKKIINNTKKNNNFSGIYDNNKVYKFNKYSEESASKSKKYSTNCTLRENDNSNNNQNLRKEKQAKDIYYQTKKDININNVDNINNIDDKCKQNVNDNLINLYDHSNIDLKNNKIENATKTDNNCKSMIYHKFKINDYNFQNRKKDILYLKKGNNNTKSHEILFPQSENIKIEKNYNLSYYPTSHINNIHKNNLTISKEETQIIYNPNKKNQYYKQNETVSEKIQKLIKQKAYNNNNNHVSLSTKLNLDTNLSLSDESEKENESNIINNHIVQRNIDISQKTIFTIFNKNKKPLILAFDLENKIFSFQDYSDFGHFEENYLLSINNDDKNNNNNKNFGNLFITIDTNLYVITGKNYDKLFMFDSLKKTMVKLSNLKNNHSNGNLLNYENNIICLSGDFNKKVEIYSINRNEWNDLPEMMIERSNSSSFVINNKENTYILNAFGFNFPTKEYLNTIEYLIFNKKNSFWQYLKYNNPKLLLLNISNLFCINYEDNRIIIIGGNNEKEKYYNDKFMQILLDENDFKNNAIVEETGRKLKDANINKKYYFCQGCKTYCIEDKQEIFYAIFDSEYNCHLFQRSNLAHDIFYFNC
jgi:hypothetical protein